MKGTRYFSMACALGALFLSACTGDSLQPTASQNTFQDGPRQRTLDQFLAEQGTYCYDADGTGACTLFDGPVGNYGVWYDDKSGMIMVVDYAGVASRWLNEQYPGVSTSAYTGKVTQEVMPDGRSRSIVEMNISNAMMYMLQGNNPQSSQVVFGHPLHRAPESDRKPAYGNGTMRLVILNTAPRVPDLVQLAKSPMAGQELRSLTFNFSGEGELYDMMGSVRRAQVSVSSTSPFMSGFQGQESTTAPVAQASITVQPLE